MLNLLDLYRLVGLGPEDFIHHSQHSTGSSATNVSSAVLP